jgi:dTDP-4-dehydrorhamnose 3,5-epimerase
MNVQDTEIPAVKLIRPKRFSDARGFFAEIYNRRLLQEAGIDADFLQDNQSVSVPRGTIRGLHFQSPPCEQAKLVRCARGAIFDVAVDIRRSSPTYGRHVSAILTGEGGEQFWVPHGFAHGFCTLTPDAEVLYKVDAYYAPAHDAGLVWNDPDLAIGWPLDGAIPTLSDKDRLLPAFRDFRSPFE